MQDAFCNDADLAGFYDWDNPWPAAFDWFAGLVAGAPSVLDLGCGTGTFAAAHAARGAEVVGVDPAAPMVRRCVGRAVAGRRPRFHPGRRACVTGGCRGGRLASGQRGAVAAAFQGFPRRLPAYIPPVV